jgi:hypothetical protein
MVSALLGGRSRHPGFRLHLPLPTTHRRQRTEHVHRERESATRAFQAGGDRVVESLRRLSFDDLLSRVGEPVRVDTDDNRTSFFLIVDRLDEKTVRVLVQGFRPLHSWMRLGAEVYLSGFRCTTDGHTSLLGVCERHDMSLDVRDARRHVA